MLRSMNRGKTIRIYLVDGTPTGTLTAEIMNWTGKVLVAPRSQLAELAKRDEAHRTGVYFLVGADPDSPARECASPPAPAGTAYQPVALTYQQGRHVRHKAPT